MNDSLIHSDFNVWASGKQAHIEHTLDQLLPSASIVPQRLHGAMRYAILGGGKRVRALLAYAAHELCAESHAHTEADAAAAAVEMIHAYSLVHDDMPCMDDDDLRRGKPSCHKQYDDATALLVGDALQSLAFQVLAENNTHLPAQRQLLLLQLLALASGSRGMAGGQAIDLQSVGVNLSQTELEHMHIHKTGALIRAAALMGAYSHAQADEARIHAVDHFTQAIGLAFQVVDDILDAEADSATLGKTAGKDRASDKATYVTILGLRQAKELAQELYQNALAPLHAYGAQALRLQQLAQFITQRNF